MFNSSQNSNKFHMSTKIYCTQAQRKILGQCLQSIKDTSEKALQKYKITNLLLANLKKFMKVCLASFICMSFMQFTNFMWASPLHNQSPGYTRPLVIKYKRTLHYDEFLARTIWGNFHKKRIRTKNHCMG